MLRISTSTASTMALSTDLTKSNASEAACVPMPCRYSMSRPWAWLMSPGVMPKRPSTPTACGSSACARAAYSGRLWTSVFVSVAAVITTTLSRPKSTAKPTTYATAMASTRGSQRWSRSTSGDSANATTVLRQRISTACVTWLSSHAPSRSTASHASTTNGTSRARTRRVWATSPLDMSNPMKARLPGLIGDEEEVRDQRDEHAVLDEDVAVDGLLDGVPDDAAVHVPQQEEHDREHALRKVH